MNSLPKEQEEEKEDFKPFFHIPQALKSNNSGELSLVREEEYDDSKVGSPMKEKILSASSHVSKDKKSAKSSMDFVEYNFENTHKDSTPPNNEDEHFSPLNDFKVNDNEKGEESSLNTADLDEENQAIKLRQEPSLQKHKWLFFPDDDLKTKWEMLLAFVIIYSCLWVPYYMAFDNSGFEGQAILIVDILFDMIFIFDIFVNFNSAYYDSQDNLIVKRSTIAKEYIKFWFWLDLISGFPFSLLVEYENTDKSLRFPKLIKLTRFIRIIKMIKERNRILKYMNAILRISSGGAENFLGPVVFMACFCHVTACLYYLLSASEDAADNWLTNYIDRSDGEKYLTAFYWVTQTVVTTGYGDIPCKTTYERMFSISVMFVGVLIYSYCLGSITNFIIMLDEQNESFNHKLITLYSMKQYYKLDFFLCKRIERFLRYGKKTQIHQQQKEFLMQLPKNLKIELSAIMYKNYVEGINFFKNKPKRLMAFICPYLKTIKFNAGDYVCDIGDRANEIFFIKSGQIALVLKSFDNFKVIRIAQGHYFGEIDVLFNKIRTYTYLADTNCELLSLQKEDFFKIFFTEFKEIGADIYRTALKKRAKIKDAIERALKYIKRVKRLSSFKKTINSLTPSTNKQTESQLYRRSTIISRSVSNASDKNDSDKDEEKSSDSSSSSNFSSSPLKAEKNLHIFNEEHKNKSPLIKLHKVKNSPGLSDSDKNVEKFEKSLSVNENIVAFEKRLASLEEIVRNFWSIHEDSLQNESFAQVTRSHDKLNQENRQEYPLETLSEGEMESEKPVLIKNSRKRKSQHALKTSHFSKNK